ncbi:MAG: hypothetical protein IM477_16145 [Microcystis sp. M090S1]|nr:hypothetical protein [Microcystis sp. M090S1]
MNALKYQTIIKNGQLSLPPLDLPEGTVVGSSVCVMQWTGVIRGETLI